MKVGNDPWAYERVQEANDKDVYLNMHVYGLKVHFWNRHKFEIKLEAFTFEVWPDNQSLSVVQNRAYISINRIHFGFILSEIDQASYDVQGEIHYFGKIIRQKW